MKPAKGKHTVKPAQRIQALCEVRAILAVAAMQHWRDPAAPSYYNIAQLLGLPRESADLADEIWNAANGPDEGPETEEHALERCCDLLEAELMLSGSADGKFGSGTTRDPVGGRPVNPDLAASATLDDRPSIAELQGAYECVREGCWTDAQDRLNAAAPLLLEIVTAALAWSESDDEDRSVEFAALDAALAKVRP